MGGGLEHEGGRGGYMREAVGLAGRGGWDMRGRQGGWYMREAGDWVGLVHEGGRGLGGVGT